MLNLPKSFIWILRGATAVPRLKPRAGFVSTCLLIFRYSLNYRKIEPFIFLDFVAIVFFFPPFHRLFFASCPFIEPFSHHPSLSSSLAQKKRYLIPALSPDSSRFVNSFSPRWKRRIARSRFPITLFSFLSSSRLPYSFTAANFRLIARREGKKRGKEKKGKKRESEREGGWKKVEGAQPWRQTAFFHVYFSNGQRQDNDVLWLWQTLWR